MVFFMAIIAIGFFGVACVAGFFFLVSAIGSVLMAIGSVLRWIYLGFVIVRSFFGGSKPCTNSVRS